MQQQINLRELSDEELINLAIGASDSKERRSEQGEQDSNAERYIRDYIQACACGDGRGDVRDIIDQVIALARSDKLAYEQLRNDIAKACKIRTSVLDDMALPKKLKLTNSEDHQLVMTAKLPNLVDLVLDGSGNVVFLLKNADGSMRVAHDVEVEEKLFIPPPREKIPFPLVSADEVLDFYQSDADGALFDDLISYHRSISDMPDDWYLLITVWDFHVWLIESVNYSPMLVFHAVAERGKTRTTRGIINIAYRGIVTESLRESYLARFTDAFGGVVCFDVMDLWRKAERAGSEDVVLNRFERGAKVPRVNKPEAGAFLDTDYYQIFGGTVIATNELAHHILDTRALTLTMKEATRQFSDDVTPDRALTLRARLTAFRARHLCERLPDAEKPVGGRLGDITRPLLQMIRLVKPDRKEELRQLIEHIDVERKSEKSETVDGQIVKALIECQSFGSADGRLEVSRIVTKVNADRPAEKQLTAQYVGRRLKALGLERDKGAGGVRLVAFDGELLRRLAEKYGISERVDRTPGEMPLTPQTPSGDDSETGVGGISGISGISGVSTHTQGGFFEDIAL